MFYGVAHRLCNGLPRNDQGFASWWVRCKNRPSRPSQGTVNGGAVSKCPSCRWDVKHNQPTNYMFFAHEEGVGLLQEPPSLERISNYRPPVSC